MLQPCISCRHWRAKVEGWSGWSNRSLTCSWEQVAFALHFHDTVVKTIHKDNFFQAEPACRDMLAEQVDKWTSRNQISYLMGYYHWSTGWMWISRINKRTGCSIVLILCSTYSGEWNSVQSTVRSVYSTSIYNNIQFGTQCHMHFESYLPDLVSILFLKISTQKQHSRPHSAVIIHPTTWK